MGSTKTYTFSLEQFSKKPPEAPSKIVEAEIASMEKKLKYLYEQARYARAWEATQLYIQHLEKAVKALEAKDLDALTSLDDLVGIYGVKASYRSDPYLRPSSVYSASRKVPGPNTWSQPKLMPQMKGYTLELYKGHISNVRSIKAAIKFEARDTQDGLTALEVQELAKKWLKSAQKQLEKIPFEMRY